MPFSFLQRWTFLCVVCLVFQVEPLSAKALSKCGQSHVFANQTAILKRHDAYLEATKRTRPQFVSNDVSLVETPNGFRIHIDYQLDGHSALLTNYLTQHLVPAAISIIETIAQVKQPVQGNLTLPRYCVLYYTSYPDYCLEVQPSLDKGITDWSYCGHAIHNDAYFEPYSTCTEKMKSWPSKGFDCVTHASPGIPDSDFLLYVTALETSYCATAVAYASYCSLDFDTGRPLAGSINFCPSSLSIRAEDFDHQIEIAVHEILHILGFTESLFDKFIDEEGNTLPLSDVIRTTLEGNRLVKKIITPTVVVEARKHFNCPYLDGAELEDEGGSGTAGSHWESRIFGGEVMDGMSGVNIIADRHALSTLTLALLQDSGWYNVNWDMTGHLEWGKNAGCSFAMDSCEEYMTHFKNQSWFCTQSGVDGCTADLHAYGKCMTSILLNGCSIVQPYTNMDCKQSRNTAIESVDWGTRYGSDALCLQIETPMVHEERDNARIVTTSRSNRNGDCYNVQCNDGIVSIDLFDQEIICENDHDVIELSQVLNTFQTGAIHCPESDRVCPVIGCPNDCSGHGWCYEHRCYCVLGFTGINCALRICNRKSSFCNCDIAEGKQTGHCFPGTENFDFLLEASSITNDKNERFKFSIVIEPMIEDLIHSVFPQALNKVLPGVSFDDVKVIAIDDVSLDPLPDRPKLQKIFTSSAYILANQLEDVDRSGTLSMELKTYGIVMIEGTLVILEAKSKEKSETMETSAIILRISIAIVMLTCVSAAIFVGFRCYTIWRRQKREAQRNVANSAYPKHPLPESFSIGYFPSSL